MITSIVAVVYNYSPMSKLERVVMTQMIYHIPVIYTDVITYPFSHLTDFLDNLS